MASAPSGPEPEARPSTSSGRPKPVLVFDGECGFCRYWVARLRARAGDRVDFIPLQDPYIASAVPELRDENLNGSVHFRDPEGHVSAAAEATFRVLEIAGVRFPLRAYLRVPGVAAVCEATYRFVARHRGFFGRFQHEP
jgi:predicted DCC family thiol-disulfide oxidoreductase YuxK